MCIVRLVLSLLSWSFFVEAGPVTSTKKPHSGDIRLVDGPNSHSGTVMVFRTYSWGYVCDDGWDIKAANVVCRQLNQGYATKVQKRNRYHSSNMVDYFLDNVICSGNETQLTECRHDGWMRHNCRSEEQAGVECAQEKPVVKTKPWDPLNLGLNRSEVEKLRQAKFSLVKSVWLEDEGITPLTVQLDGVPTGPVCPDHFTAAEANVACRELGLGTGGDFLWVPMSVETFPAQRHLLMVGHCRGNETSLTSCLTFASADVVPCSTDLAVALNCTHGNNGELACPPGIAINDQYVHLHYLLALADLVPDVAEMERSSYLQKLSLWHLDCALEEGCLPPQVHSIRARDPYKSNWHYRSLLRFSSIIENSGLADFVPSERKENWEWHACHMHYHSMKVFAEFKLLDSKREVVAHGQKASFCLEDSSCHYSVKPKFQCSNVADHYGSQGISPGCRDSYFHNFDCQWIDVTDVPSGMYEFHIAYNPRFLVSESNFANNGIKCVAYLQGSAAVLRNCQTAHPLDLFH